MRASSWGWARWASLLCVVSLSATASQAIRMDLERLTAASDQIVIGKISRVESRWTKDRRLIVTEVDVAVTEPLKGASGAAGPTVRILQPGGVVGEVGQKVAGLPRFRAGEEVVLFLEAQGGQLFTVAGMAQGKFRVERSSDGRAVFAVPDERAGLSLVEPALPAAEGTALTTMPLETLRTRVKETLRRSGQPR